MRSIPRLLLTVICLLATPLAARADLNLSISLGQAGPTEGAMSLDVEASTLTVATAKAAGFAYIGMASGPVEVIDTAGHRQIVSPSGLFDLTDVKDGSNVYQYTELSFYHGAGTKSGSYYPGTSLYKTIRFTPSVSGTETTLVVAETEDSTTKTTTYEYDSANGAWSLITAEGNRKETQTVTTGSGTRTVTTDIRDGSNALISKVVETYTTYAWGEQLTQRVNDPAGLALTSTWTYESDGAGGGRITSRLDEDGYWERYTYNSGNRLTKVVSQYLDAALSATEGASRVRTITYSGDNDQTEVTTLLGQEIGRRYTLYTISGGVQTRRIEVATVAGAAAGASTNLVTATTYLSSGERIAHPDGTLTTITRAESSGILTTTTETGKPNTGGTAVSEGKRIVLVQNATGQTVSETVTDLGSSLKIAESMATATDAFGRPTEIEYLNGTSVSFTYGCCGLEQKTDATGMVTTYSYDDFGNVDLESRDGLSLSSTYDPLGRLLRRHRLGTDSSSILIAGADYNLAGRPTATYDQFGTTAVAETSSSSRVRTRTETLPGGATRITATYPDGKPKEISGTAVAPQKYEYGVDSSNGQFLKKILLGTGGSETEWTKTFLDLADRPWKKLYPDSATATSYWNAKGQLARVVDPDGVTTLVGYDDLGEQTTLAIDANNNDTINTGSDRVTRTETAYVTAHGHPVAQTTTTEWNGGSPIVTAQTDASLNSLDLWASSFGVEGHSSVSLTGSGDFTTTTTVPSTGGQTTLSSYSGWKLASRTVTGSGSEAAGSQVYAYDPHHRVASLTANGLATASFTYNPTDLVATAIQAGVTTSFTYGDLGRRTSITKAGATTTFEYFPNGLLESVSGDRAYPASYTYDPQGRVKTLTTTGVAGSAVTTSNYDGQRGWLTSKRYADSKGPDYTYSPAGRRVTREWARGVTSTYTYNDLGDLSGLDYSDSTPDVTFGYDQRGQRSSATQNGATYSYARNDAGQLTEESITGGPLNGFEVASAYDTLGRFTTITPEANTAVTQSYTYDGASRLATASTGDFQAAYEYAANSARVTEVDFLHSSTQTARTEKVYDTLGRLTAIATKKQSDSTVLSSHSYTYNDLNQRIQATLKDASKWLYDYDDLGQVTSGVQKTSSDVQIPGREFEYEFDSIGNRTETIANGHPATYTSNTLNQSTEREVPGVIDVSGKADSAATVTVNNTPTERQGSYFYKALAVNNSSAPQFPEINVVAVKNHVGPNDEDLIAEKTGHVYLEKSPEAYGYDDDGNRLSDGKFNYTFDAENRLVGFESISAAPTAAKVKGEYSYDPASRRIQKKVWKWNNATSAYDLTETSKFLYQGWNLVAEIDAAGNITKSHLWGSDLSGSLQGAGGVGGLLTTSTHGTGATQLFPAYDGNGNVMAMADVSTAAVRAEFEYDPFGQKIRASGPDVAKISFGYSTHFDDRETGFISAKERILTSDGWLNRDPIKEFGGLNLYGYVGNDPINSYDPFGLQTATFAITPGTIPTGPGVMLRPDPISLGLISFNIGYYLGEVAGSTPANYLDPNSGTVSEFYADLVYSKFLSQYYESQFGEETANLEPRQGFSFPIQNEEDAHAFEEYLSLRQSDPDRARRLLERHLSRKGLSQEEIARRLCEVFAKAPTSLWSKTEFDGTRVYQRSDLIDPSLVDARGRTNLQRMQAGLAPIGPDGNSINLHHMLQSADSPLAEMTASFHQQNSSVININPNTIPSGINRAAFDAFRRKYWMNRADDFSP